MLPGLDGFEVCRRLRGSGSEVPLIMLTARTNVPDRVAGLTIGADDYVTKPFSFEELLARIQAVLRRRGLDHPQDSKLSGAGLVLDPQTHEVYRDGVRLELTRTEFSLLALLMSHPNRVFTRETLVNRVWGFDYYGDTNVVDVHISHLRRKIGDRGGERRTIQTVYGMGYTFRSDGEKPQEPVE
ncbi:response regulator transcription factor [Rubrobacter indicoceani]|uniref:response regulator transcription factor n=1 Tax=Rubrobacter indicoceani TaxID=2051957 RepID=UPI0023E14004|nr:response regulator transcription factor [Rubrobacter indicoceani]